MVVLVSSFLVIYSYGDNTVLHIKSLVLVLSVYALSNIAFIFLDSSYFSLRWFRTSLFLLDIVLISLMIYFSHGIDSDMYLVYFLLIFMAGGKNNVGHAFMMTIVVVIIYGTLVSLRGGELSINNTVLLMRIPFFFIVSFIFLYYSESERKAMEKQVTHMERLSSLGGMFAAVLHEIKNPLSIIIGYSGLMEKIPDDKTRDQVWSEVVSAAEKASGIISNIITYVKQGESTERSLLNMNEILARVLGFTGEQLKIDKINVSTEFCSGLPEVSGNPQSLQQVFVNLVKNARNAIKTQEGKKGGEIKIVTSQVKKSVIIEVSDNGPGIKKDDLERIFEPFFTTNTESTGLGLSLSYNIIQQHGGKISVRSEYGKGAVFTVELPIAKAQN
jgi:signal transduction histidine kinase